MRGRSTRHEEAERTFHIYCNGNEADTGSVGNLHIKEYVWDGVETSEEKVANKSTNTQQMDTGFIVMQYKTIYRK